MGRASINWSGGYMIYAGIDMAKKKFDYCIIDTELSVIKRGIFVNNIQGFSEFLRIIKKYKNIKLGIESTGIYHVNLYTYLINNNYNIILLNPLETKLLKSSRINRKIAMTKNQLIRDLDLLYPGLTEIVNTDSKYFIEIISNIDKIIENTYKIKYISDSKHSEIRNILINSSTHNAVKYDIDINIETLELLNKQLKETKKIIEDEYNKMDSKIRTIPGIGTITGSIILSSIGDINKFDSVLKLRAYSGMDPVVKQSGDYNITSNISKRGNPIIRYALYLSTVSAIKFNPVIKRYYTRKKNDGMKGNKLMIACSNKLLNIIYSVLKNNKDFEDPLDNIN